MFTGAHSILRYLAVLPLQESGRTQEQYVTELRHMPEGWLAVGGLALLVMLCWAVVWMYRHEGRAGSSLRARMLLAGIRCLIILVLAAILLLQWLLHQRYRRQMLFMPGFTRMRKGSSISQREAPVGRETSTIDAGVAPVGKMGSSKIGP